MQEKTEKTCFQEEPRDDLKLRAADPDSSNAELSETKAQPDAASSHPVTAADLSLKESTQSADKKHYQRSDTPSIAVPSNPPIGKSAYHGLLRHRLIIAACLSFSAIIVLMSSFDLKQMISRPILLDSGLHLKYPPNPADLPPNLSYPRENNYNYGNYRQSCEGLRPVLQTDWDLERYGFVDEKGNLVIKPKYAEVGDFHDGLAWVKLQSDAPVANNSLRGCINRKGELVIPAKFQSIGSFHDGVAPAILNGVGGLINTSGKIILETKTSTLPEDFGPVFSAEQTYGKHGLVDLKGKWITEPIYERIEKINTQNGIYHQYDRLVVTVPEYSSQSDWRPSFPDAPDSKYLKAMKDGRYGVIDSSGKVLVPFKFDDIYGFSSGYGIVRDLKHGITTYHFVDSAGKLVKKFGSFIDFTNFGELTAIRPQEGNWKVLDAKGNFLKNSIHFDEPIVKAHGYWFEDGLAPVLINGKCGYLNASGQIAIKPTFEFATPFHDGLALVWDGSFWSYINTKGQQVSFGKLNKFYNATPFSNGVATADLPGPFYALLKQKAEDDVNVALKQWKGPINPNP